MTTFTPKTDTGSIMLSRQMWHDDAPNSAAMERAMADIEFRQQPDGMIEILDHEKGQKSWYDNQGMDEWL